MKLDWKIFSFPLAVWGISRAAILVWGLVVVSVLPVRELQLVGDAPRPEATGLSVLIEPWARWDTLWYLRIATTGYSTSDLTGGFFPLYPLMIRALTAIVPNALFNALVISNLAALGAFTAFYQIAQDLFDEPTARRALIYWVVFPTSFYFFAGYAEALLAFTALVSIQAARRNRWLGASLAGAFATLTRPPGFLILAPLSIEWLGARVSALERLRRAVPLILIPLALGAFMLYLQLQFADAVLWLRAWNNVAVAPWDLAVRTLQAIAAGIGLGNNLVDFALTFFLLGLTLIGATRLPVSLTAFALGLILVQMMAYPPTLGFAEIPMAGLARRVSVVFPAFLTLAQVWHGKFKEPLWITISVALQILFISVFVRWLWID